VGSFNIRFLNKSQAFGVLFETGQISSNGQINMGQLVQLNSQFHLCL
jgi:hypothetical protein